MSILVEGTPVERHNVNGYNVLVKREDLSCPYPGPSFSKMRGVMAHIANLPEQVATVGVLDTYHSKAGWAVAWACRELGKECIDYWPRYKRDDPSDPLPRQQQRYAADLGASTIALKAGRSAILYHTAKRHLAQFRRPDLSYMMPNALKLPESVTENAREARLTCERGLIPSHGTMVISISSGTVAAGVILGLHQAGFLPGYSVILHMGYSRSQEAALAYIEKRAGLDLKDRVKFIDEGYGYADSVSDEFHPRFPINRFYDAKAFWWMERNPGVLLSAGPVVFWNIGD